MGCAGAVRVDAGPTWSVGRCGKVVLMDDGRAEVVELQTRLEHVERVAAIDIAKASAMVCTRLPHGSSPGRRVQRTWPVKAVTAAVIELADRLVADRVELV